MTDLTVGLLGSGSMGRTHLAALRALGARVLVHGGRGAAAATAELGGEPVDALSELLERSDVIDIATPTPTHLPFARQALAAGRHVICEKPLARTSADAAVLAEAAATAGRRLLPAHVVRYEPAAARLRAAVAAGELGTLEALRLHRSGERPAAVWFADPAQSGGVVLDLLIHDLDLARWIAGDVVEVRASAGDDAGALEAVVVELRHANGVLSRIDGAWRPIGSPFRTSYRAVGTKGRLAGSSADPGEPGESPYLLELRDFLAAIEVGTTPRVTARDGVEAVRLCEAVASSLRMGGPVPHSAAPSFTPEDRAGSR